MELTQNGRYIGMGKKYHIAINAVQDTTAGWSLPMKEHCNTEAKSMAYPSLCWAAPGHVAVRRGTPVPGGGR